MEPEPLSLCFTCRFGSPEEVAVHLHHTARADVHQHHIIAIAHPTARADRHGEAIAARIGNDIAPAIVDGFEAMADHDRAIAKAARADIGGPAVSITMIATIIAPILAIFLARFAKIMPRIANVVAVALANGLTQVAALLTDILAIMPQLGGLRRSRVAVS